MLEILAGIIVSSCISVGVYVSAQFNNYEAFDDSPEIMRKERIDGAMILWWVRWYGSYLPYLMRKPLYFCLPCMGSLWSVPALLYLSLPWYYWPFFMLGTCGINGLIRYNLNT